jgi:hypothetical protein
MRDEMLTRWLALPEAHRVFLRRARDVERTLPRGELRGDGMSKVLPLMNWREIGESCGMSEIPPAAALAARPAADAPLFAREMALSFL